MLTFYSCVLNCNTIEEHRHDTYTFCCLCDRRTKRKLCFAAASLRVAVEVHLRQVFPQLSEFMLQWLRCQMCRLLNAERGSKEKRPPLLLFFSSFKKILFALLSPPPQCFPAILSPRGSDLSPRSHLHLPDSPVEDRVASTTGSETPSLSQFGE